MRIARGHGRLSSRAILTGLVLAALGAVPGVAAAATSRHGLGLAEPARAPSLASKIIRFAGSSPPASVDLTPYAPAVGDQGQVNSCAAWATDYTALGYWENRQGISGGVLAPMYTYSQVTGGIDNGSSIESHLSIAKSQGVDSWADYWQGAYDYWTMPTSAEIANAASWKLTNATQLAIGENAASTVTQQSIEQAVAAGDPVVIGIPVYDNFMYLTAANHGFYAGIGGGYDGGHAVTVLGYDSTGVRIENSWGTEWGDSGFATLSWSYVNQYVLDAVAVGQLVGSAPATTAPVNVSAPVISGSAAVGQTLTTSLGAWSPYGTASSVRWQRSSTGSSWSDIGGATSPSYALQSTDEGGYLRAIVTESNSYGQASATSAAVGPIASGPPQNTVLPAVSGSARVGGTVSANLGVWTPAAKTYSYAWQYSADGHAGWVSIAGARSASFTIGAMYADTYVRVRVTATNAAGQTIVTSQPVGPVGAAAPAHPSRPVGRRVILHVGRARVSSRTVSFAVAVDGVTGKPQATAVTHGRRVRLRSRGSGTHFTFSGRLSRGRWVVTVTLVSRHASFTVLIKR